MSERTGLLIEDLENFVKDRAYMAYLGHPTPDMPGYEEYPPDAIVPIEPRPFSDNEHTPDWKWLRSRLATEKTSTLGHIALVRPLNMTSNQLIELQQYAANHPPSVKSSHFSAGKAGSLTVDIPDYLWQPYGATLPYATNKEGKKVRPVFAPPNRPGMRTVTQIPTNLLEGEDDRPQRTPSLERIGVHFDNWFTGRDAEERLQAPNIFCLNLGPGDRSVIIGCDLFDIEQDSNWNPPAGLKGLNYFRQYIAYCIERGQPQPCLVMRLGPGEGYICPTEAVSHEGSTEEAWWRLVRGGYNPPAASPLWLWQYGRKL